MTSQFSEFSIFSPAKVNLHLIIKDVRPDGFHNLESVFLAVNFGDTLHFKVREDKDTVETYINGNSSKNELKRISLQDNIILKAIALFREKTGFPGYFNVKVDKKIPIGGGLGGGSSNAAAALLALNRMTASHVVLEKEALLDMAAVLGSDVPFFIHETPAAWVSGRGENITPIDVPQMFLVLVNPGFSSSTAAAFKLLDKYRSLGYSTTNQHSSSTKFWCWTRPTRTGEKYDITSSWCLSGSWLNNYCINDFLEVFGEKEKSIYMDIISRLKELGAIYANLSGAGSTCFGLFTSYEQAEKATESLQNNWDFVVNTENLKIFNKENKEF